MAKEKPVILKEKGHLVGYYNLFHLEDTILALRQ
jgi:hypothetical protein